MSELVHLNMQEVHTQQLYDQVTQNADVLSVIFNKGHHSG